MSHTIEEKEIHQLNEFTSVIKPKDKRQLETIIYFYSKNYPNDSLNWLDVSDVTDMSDLFKGDFEYIERYNHWFLISNKYNGDISKWDVSNVKNMSDMFANSKFNGDISKWDVSNVTNMHGMFYESEFD